MSAYMVEKAHIDYLLTVGLAWGEGGSRSPLSWLCPGEPVEGTHEAGEPWGEKAIEVARQRRRTLTRETADGVGVMLWCANAESFDFRYDRRHTEDTEGVEAYTFEAHPAGRVPDPVQVLKSIACLEYQSCEHPDWERREAFAFLKALEGRAISELPGYKAAIWGAPGRRVRIVR